MNQLRVGGDRKPFAWLRDGLAMVLVCYAICVLFDAALYRFGGSTSLFNAQIRDLLYSFDVFDMRSHPLYRDWLKGFVFDPGTADFSGTAEDTYKAYNLHVDAPTLHFGPIDALGWPNATPVDQAKVLFLGDSFTYGAGSGTKDSIYSFFTAQTGLPVYAVARGGYGLPHYPLILNQLTSPAQPANERFTGKKAIAIYYNGNDALADTIIFKNRLAIENENWTRHLSLTAVRRLYDFLQDSRLNMKRASASGTKSNADAKDAPPPSQAPSGTAAKRDKDLLPSSWERIYLRVPSLATGDQPFALHPFYLANMDFETIKRRFGQDIDDNLTALAQAGARSGVTVQVVLMPTALQVLAPFFDQAHIQPDSPFAKQYTEALAAFDALQDYVGSQCHARGMETLDLREVFRQANDPGKLYWPWDTHLTPYGNEVAAKALAQRFGQP